MAVTKKTETKATAKTAVKAAPAETAAKKTAVVKEEAPAVKAAPVEKAAPAAKAAPAKKAPAKKAAEPKSSVVIEFAGKQIVAKEVLAAAKKAFTKANKGVTIKTIEIYVKPEENVAYYVVNGQGSDDYKIEL
ncbi:MAG: DUF6465 family protein [Lachnospiraceae bacterium]